VTFETQALREARSLLDSGGATALADAQTYIEAHSHPRLWRLLAEAALEKLDFGAADYAFVHCADYMGVQFVKRCRLVSAALAPRATLATRATLPISPLLPPPAGAPSGAAGAPSGAAGARVEEGRASC
jgi:hypothetical protein